MKIASAARPRRSCSRTMAASRQGHRVADRGARAQPRRDPLALSHQRGRVDYTAHAASRKPREHRRCDARRRRSEAAQDHRRRRTCAARWHAGATTAVTAPPLPAKLRWIPNTISVPPKARACPRCGKGRRCIGHDTTEILHLIPAQVICASTVARSSRARTARPRSSGRRSARRWSKADTWAVRSSRTCSSRSSAAACRCTGGAIASNVSAWSCRCRRSPIR